LGRSVVPQAVKKEIKGAKMQKQHLFSKTGFATGILAAAVVSSSALGAGFEKNVMWSGKWVGVGGAAVSAVQGAESLFFNPAGLAMSHQGFEVSGNFSPTWGEFKGPIAVPNQQVSSGYHFSPVFGALVDYGITPQWGIGVGAFVAAGTKADYDTVPFPNNLPAGTIHSDIYVVDYSIGTGYEVIPGLKIGAAWRISQVKAGLKTVSQVGATTNFAYVNIDDITATKYNGFRVGAQYTASDKKWGLGVNYRSNVDFTGKGNFTGQVNAAGTGSLVTALPSSSDVTVASALPSQIEIGGNYAALDNVRLFLDYVWTNYSHNQTLSIVGPNLPSIPLYWKNMSNVRFAAECTAIQDWAFRAGYVYTSQVTPESYARATFTAPGHGNTITVGAGHSLMNNALELNGALERSWTSGTTTAADQTYYGDYFAADWALHLGATLRL
jgi:long-chain fatty acid transport protein